MRTSRLENNTGCCRSLAWHTRGSLGREITCSCETTTNLLTSIVKEESRWRYLIRRARE
ncbi:hypothetical protein PUN28_010156 [Cardiocondyla obscurior]|uniref:Uncharacterized protein n=1 Tax=Cardiocondyla obscurior TaxID=286306 RepID=A0AAW2FPU2_9HYME